MVAGLDLSAEKSLRLAPGEKWALAVLCVGAGAAPLAARWIFGDVPTRVAYGLLVAGLYVALTLFVRNASSSTLRSLWEVPFAFFVLAVVQVLNNVIPG
jgi:hypothetical protein